MIIVGCPVSAVMGRFLPGCTFSFSTDTLKIIAISTPSTYKNTQEGTFLDSFIVNLELRGLMLQVHVL
jgi:hypothetical protein